MEDKRLRDCASSQIDHIRQPSAVTPLQTVSTCFPSAPRESGTWQKRSRITATASRGALDRVTSSIHLCKLETVLSKISFETYVLSTVLSVGAKDYY